MSTTFIQAKQRLLNYLDAVESVEESPILSLLLSVRSVLEGDLMARDNATNLIGYHDVFNDNLEGKRAHDLADAISEKADLEAKHLFSKIMILRQENIRQLIRRYLEDKQSILEVGSGTLDIRGDSFLSSGLGREMSQHFVYCDINPEMVKESIHNNENARIKQCDIKNLSKAYKSESFDVVIGHNALDTLSYTDLDAGMSEIAKVLKDGGMLIHVMNMEPFIYSTVHDLSRTGAMMLPIFDKSDSRRYVLLDSIPKDCGLTEGEETFLHYLSTLAPDQMEKLFHCLNDHDDANLFSQLGRKCADNGIVMTPMEHYVKNVETVMEDSGFDILSEKYHTSEQIVKARVNGPYEGRSLKYGPQGKVVAEDETLGWGECRLRMKTHAIIAKKPSRSID